MNDMSQVLSQDEVDALLKGLSGGDIDTEPDDSIDPSEIRAYDLTSRDRIVRGRMPNLEMTNEKFARMFRTTLSSWLKKIVNINMISVSMVKYSEFLKKLPLPTSLHVFRMEPLRGSALLNIDAQIIFTLVDILFGGTGRESYKIEGRDFTAIEAGLIRKVVLSALADLESAWKPMLDVNVVYFRSENNPEFVQIVTPTDVVIIGEFEIELEFVTGKMTLCIPYSMIEPIREKLQAGYQSDKLEFDKEWADRFKEELKMASVEYIVELGKANATGRELMNIKVGDVILLEQYVKDELKVYVEGLQKFKGQPGYYRGNYAIEISEITMQDENNLFGF